MSNSELIRRLPPATPEWALLVGLSYVSWPLEEWRWRPVVGRRVVVGINEWFKGAAKIQLLWIHPQVFFNGWSSSGPEYLQFIRVVTVGFISIVKTSAKKSDVLVEILSVIDPWELHGLPPTTVNSLVRIKPTRGTTEIVSSGDRTVIYRCDDSDQTFQYYLFKEQRRIVLLIDQGPTASYFYWGHGALSETQLEEAVGADPPDSWI